MTRVITVPKDKNAMRALDLNQATDEQLSELILDEDDFKALWATGLFDSINALVGTVIDLYEDDSIVDIDKINIVLESSIFKQTKRTDKLAETIDKIHSLFREAKKRGTGIFFYF